MEIEEFDLKLTGVRHGTNGQRAARCPGHDDRQSSLSYGPGEHGGIVVTCHAGCELGVILGVIGLSVADVMGRPHITAEYKYLDDDGVLLYTVERWANPKTFKCRPNLPPPAERVLYSPGNIAYARDAGKTLFVVEGEKDVDTLYEHGWPATCNVGGAGKWLPQYTEALRGLNVVVVADNDEPGRAHARAVAKALEGVAASVTVMVSPYGKDASDLLEAGYSLDVLQLLPDHDGAAIYSASSVRPREIRWVWPGYIPAGKLTIFEGDPGDGKSLLTIDLAARWSTGAPMPDGVVPAGPVPVMLVSAEDDMEDTIVPRLIAAGANLHNIKLVPHGITEEMPFSFTTDLPWLTEAILTSGARVVVFDPLTAFIGERTDTNNDASTRRAMYPLKVLAGRTGAAVLAVRHLNKGSGKALYRGGGSIGFSGAARGVFLVGRHPEDRNVRVISSQKFNIGEEPDSRTFEIMKGNGGLPYVRWDDQVTEITSQNVVDGGVLRRASAEDKEKKEFESIAREYEREFLNELLADGPMSWRDIVAAGKDAGFTEHSLRRARVDARLIQTGKTRSPNAMWAKPAQTTESDGDPDFAHFAHGSGMQPASKNGGQSGQSPDDGDSALLSDDDREAALQAAELVCEICQTTVAVGRFYAPYWAIRCADHNPMFFHGGAS